MSLVLLLGGARSGKSSLAVRLAAVAGGPVTVIATAEPSDDEMAERIRAHREARPPSWRTIEEPLELGRAVEAAGHDDVIVVDCLSLWVSNAMESGLSPVAIVRAALDVANGLEARTRPAFAVSNEVGLGLVPMHPVGRAYRDVLGSVNAACASAADRSLLVVAGRALALDLIEDLLPIP
jgi:adenosylcobinamide kinase / adenosylcobinamide-phosphate guanylyltransferase